MKAIKLPIAGESMVLDARRALFWPERRWLMVADLHLGKASLLRQAGAAIPRGTTTRDLARLGALIDDYRPDRVIVLGDLIHGAERAAAPWLDTLGEWREQHAAVELVLVAGNHDRHMPLAALGFAIQNEIAAKPFLLRHAPDQASTLHVLGGHVHPGIVMRDGRTRLRLPAFWISANRSVLPAFGSLCGLAPHGPDAADRVFAITPGGIVDLSGESRNT
ncbi:MAG: ligase-associated DNA damage response endonuclease PdeM [Dokdonella sp.]|uniref:ligase-associated DNA damage response endonuclease PdeM n=1 Tax=Dokdonella sp. TaxID=2291710 RepID=UPI003264EF71